MADDAKLKLTFRLVPADDRLADPVVLDDIVRLIRQAAATAPKDTPKVTEPGDGFRVPAGEEERRPLSGLHSKIMNRIEQASAASQAAVEKRAQTASQPDAQPKLTEESLEAAQRVVAAIQRALFRAVVVRIPDGEGRSSTATRLPRGRPPTLPDRLSGPRVDHSRHGPRPGTDLAALLAALKLVLERQALQMTGKAATGWSIWRPWRPWRSGPRAVCLIRPPSACSLPV